MTAIKDLLRQVADPALRGRLADEIDRLGENRKFGLVFEEHIPECTPLYGVPIRRGSTVARRAGGMAETFTVRRIEGEAAVCVGSSNGTAESIPLAQLVPVARFGEPIFPALEPVAKVMNAPGDPLWHALIEADNYHALQLLEHLCPCGVDCIYIDPPYNTGARDWKYNNDYVDAADAWRHSKWLSMMKKRLVLAKRILNPDTGVMICSIDDYEISHLLPLLEEIYPAHNINTVIVNHHPQGGGGDNISRTHEYALFLTPLGRNILKGNKQLGIEEQWSLARSGTDVRNYRHGRPNQFYAIYVDPATLEVKGIGERLTSEESYSTSDTPEGYKAIYPLGKKDGSERVWRYERSTMAELIGRGDIVCTPKFALKVVKRRDIKHNVIFSLWNDPRYNAGTNGTDLLLATLGTKSFAYPKSLYTIADAIKFSTQDNPGALVVDFFAGSGTTLHAVNLLNAEDGGRRRCILVTNNEVSEAEARDLKAAGHRPGDAEWERHGVCASVTWPRARHSIMGRRDDGTALSGEYFTSLTRERPVRLNFHQIGFATFHQLDTPAKKKQLVSLLGKDSLPQSLVEEGARFVVPEGHRASILFDDSAVEEWLAALEDRDYLRDFYVVTQNAALFRGARARVQEMLGGLTEPELVKLPMGGGFRANAEYFRLGFLDKKGVSLGRQFREILPLLWLKAGAVGERPELGPRLGSGPLPDMLVLPQNGLAVLIDEDRRQAFADALRGCGGVRTVFFVTNSREAFQEMSGDVGAERAYQLYRDYLDNFVIGGRRDDA